MIRRSLVLATMVLLGFAGTALADIPLMVNHQGLAKVDGVPFTGNGLFKFGFVAADDTWLWTNDGTHVGESVSSTSPDGSVIIPVSNGIYHVRLGSTAITGMVVIPSSIFDDDDVELRVIFNDGSTGEQVLSPDQPVTSVPYAYHAAKADNASLLNGKSASQLLPQGVIVMWSGTIATIPEGWTLCDGTGGTPDLRDRFIVGATQDDSGVAKTNVKGSLMITGGEHEHTLIEDEMPSHRHRWESFGEPDGGPDVARKTSEPDFTGPTGDGLSSGYWKQDMGHMELRPELRGGDQPHENCPPFYALAFIMKQ